MFDVESMVLSAQNDLLSDSDAGLRDLIDATIELRRKHIGILCSKFPFLEYETINSLYIESVWEVVQKYDRVRVKDFYGYLYVMVRNKAVDIARKELPRKKHDLSLDMLIEISLYDNGGQELMLSDSVPSAEDCFFTGQASIGDFIEQLDANEKIGDLEKAIVMNRIEHGTSLDEVIDFCDLGHLFKNRQALWRASIKKLQTGVSPTCKS